MRLIEQTSMKTSEQLYYDYCLTHNRPYLGQILWSLQGSPVRHIHMCRLVEHECQHRQNKPMSILEIGSWAGGSAITWAEAIQCFNGGAGRLVCVDPWKLYFDPAVVGKTFTSTIYFDVADALEKEEIFPLFLHNIRASGQSELITPLRASSEEAFERLCQDSFDLIFVDGDHAYSRVLQDLEGAARLVKEGGILCGDDLELQLWQIDRAAVEEQLDQDCISPEGGGLSYHPGVTLAISEFFGTVSLWDGFWAMRRRGTGWELVTLPDETANQPLPAHLRGIGPADYLEAAATLLEEEEIADGISLLEHACALATGPLDDLSAPSARMARVACSKQIIQALEQATKQPDRVLAWQLLGLIRMERGEWVPSRTALARAAGLYPKCASLHSKLGVVYYALEQFDEAERAFARALQIAPNAWDAHNNLAVLHWCRGNTQLAVTHALSAVDGAPDDTNTWLNCARMLGASGNPEPAVELLQRFLLRHEDTAALAEKDRWTEAAELSQYQTLRSKYAPWILIGPDHFGTLAQLARSVRDVPGELAELGVYKGGVSAALSEIIPEKTVHCFDTFCGMPETGFVGEYHRPGDFADTSVEAVRALFQTTNFVLHPGRFPQTAEDLGGLRFAFVHIDGDYYETTRDAIDWFYPRLSPGGVMLFDDYGFVNCPGVARAVHESAGRYGYAIQTINHQAVIRRGKLNTNEPPPPMAAVTSQPLGMSLPQESECQR